MSVYIPNLSKPNLSVKGFLPVDIKQTSATKVSFLPVLLSSVSTSTFPSLLTLPERHFLFNFNLNFYFFKNLVNSFPD